MSYVNVYPSRINWENEPSILTPLNATNLNKIDYAVYEHDQTLETWDTTKANQSDLLLSVKSIDYNTTTGVFVFTWQNGTTKTVDLNIEKIPISFSMDANGIITMTTSDGTQYTADVGALIKTYTFDDSTEIDFTTTTDQNGNKTVTASIKAGSITGSKLEPNYLANCQSAAGRSENYAGLSESEALNSEAWAVGERGGVPVSSDDPTYNNNAKYWSDHAGAQSISSLTDTAIGQYYGLGNNQALIYDQTTSKWINSVLFGNMIDVDGNNHMLNAAIGKYNYVTLTAGSTQITITGVYSTDLIDVYTNVYGLNPESMTYSNGNLIITFPAQSIDVSVCVIVKS